jgi:hypothetical protein
MAVISHRNLKIKVSKRDNHLTAAISAAGKFSISIPLCIHHSAKQIK